MRSPLHMVGLFEQRGAGLMGGEISRFNTIARNRATGKFWVSLNDRLVSPLINLYAHIANHFVAASWALPSVMLMCSVSVGLIISQAA